MAQITVKAIVLRAADYREYDRILTLFAQGRGAITAAARFCRRIKSPLLNVAVPFVYGEFVLTERQGRYTVKSCSVENAHYPLREHPVHLACAAYLCTLCEEAVQPGQPNDALLDLLLRALAHLSYGKAHPLSAATAFLVRFLDAEGIGPILDRCARCAGPLNSPSFGAEGALCGGCARGARRVEPALLSAIDALRPGPFDPPEQPSREGFDLLARYALPHMARSEKPLRYLYRMLEL